MKMGETSRDVDKKLHGNNKLKTFLTAIYCLVRAILYPETKIIVASDKLKQAIQVIEKIDDERKKHPNIRREISDLKTNPNDARVEFHNGSWLKVVASNDNARSHRANVIIVDEFRQVKKDVIDTVLRKFLTAPRQPAYLNKEEYKHLKERNQELYLSSAWYKAHWSYEKMLAYFKSMVKGSKYFVCSLPYQLAIKENLLDEEQVKDEMSEDDFNEIKWMMEMEALWFGESEKAYYKYDELDRNRTIKKPLYPKSTYDDIRDKKFKYEQKQQDEIRLLSCDISVMAGKQNDASITTLIQLIPTSNGYERRISYMESQEGGHTQEQARRIKNLYYELDCDYVVLDTNGVGIGVYDALITPIFDEESNTEYPAWTCINDEAMAERCIYNNAKRIIFSIKANQQTNSSMAIALRDNIKKNKIKLLSSELEGKEYLKSIKGIESLPIESFAKLNSTYLQVTFAINEMINLEAEITDVGLVKLKEPRSGRKDRYSSILYGNFIADVLEKEFLSDESGAVEDDDDLVYF